MAGWGNRRVASGQTISSYSYTSGLKWIEGGKCSCTESSATLPVGPQDFSEDTYRTLAAADNAVMLVDGAKGIEPQTRKLFEVARMRRLPIFTVVNKMDRPALNGFEIIEQLEKEFKLPAYPINW